MILELVSSRLVARHVGASLMVWTSVIGIILGGICLGNVLGGRLADRVDPRRAVGPLFGLGSFLTLFTLWMNAGVGYVVPGPEHINWELRTVLVVMLDFLVPATVLGMVGPVVAKMAVDASRKAGTAIGDVYFWGAVGSIAGTFLTGFVLMYLAPSSTILLVVAAMLALLSAALIGEIAGLAAGLVTALLLGLGSIDPLVQALSLGAVDFGSYRINFLALAGNAAACALAAIAVFGLWRARLPQDAPASAAPVRKPSGKEAPEPDEPRPSLLDLAVLAFLVSLAFMAFEMVAGRLVQRYLGSSIYGWTSVIGVLLAGLSLGNYLGGKIADFVHSEHQASWLFLAASILTLSVIVSEKQPKWIAENVVGGTGESLLRQAISLSKVEAGPVRVTMSWPYRVLFVVTLVFFLPAVSMGTVSPVVAKLAVDRLKRYRRTGTAIGQVYAWGMVGSILGTFLTGFVLIHILGTKGVVLVLAAALAFGATMLGSVWHAVWAGVPLGLCVLAFTPPGAVDSISRFIPYVNGKAFEEIGTKWGIREERGFIHSGGEVAADLNSQQRDYAWIDESNYYYIKVNNEVESNDVVKRTLVLDNLIHGYFILGHPERLDYDYEHIYALVAYRAARASGKVKFKPAPPAKTDEPKPSARPSGAEPSTKPVEPPQPKAAIFAKDPSAKPSDGKNAQDAGTTKTSEPKSGKDAPDKPSGLHSVQASGGDEKKKLIPPGKEAASDTFPVQPLEPSDAGTRSELPGVEQSSMTTLFLGGGAYCFQRHMQYAYPGTGVDVAEIDPSVTRANWIATGLPRNSKINTYWGDARQFVELHEGTKKYDLVFGDAFNDFSVPWHLTTREFNEKIKKMLTPSGVYMINIIDAYESDKEAEKKAKNKIKDDEITDKAAQERIHDQALADAQQFGGFVGAWTRTARLTFDHVYIFGTDDTPGSGQRETFVVVASNQDLDLKDLGRRADDPKFYNDGKRTEPLPYSPEDEAAIELRSRKIILTDDYAPVENLLAPVAKTRGDD
jgi:MFS family permease